MEIYKTNNYEQFKLQEGNRIINEFHVDKLANSIKVMNLLADRPILVTKELVILDGQHRFLAAKKIGVDVYYHVAASTDIMQVPTINSMQKQWNVSDYISLYAKRGNKNYQWIEEIIKAYNGDMTATYIIRFLGPYINKASALKEGRFEVSDEEKASIEMRIPYVLALAKLFNVIINTISVSAFSLIIENPNYEHARMIEQATKYPSLFKRQVSIVNTVKMLDYVYNYRRQKRLSLLGNKK